MKLQYLGTAASEGWPAVFCACESCEQARRLGGKNIRTRCQALVDDTLLLDLPPDNYMHSLLHGVKLHQVTHLLVTHSHSDHWYPAELGLHRSPFCEGQVSFLEVYGNDMVEKSWRQEVEGRAEEPLSCSFTPLTPFVPVQVGRYTVTPLRALHDRKECCLNYLISDGSATLLYAHDTGIFPEDTWGFLKGKTVDLVSLDCNYLLDSDGGNHMGLPDAIMVKKRLLQEEIAHPSTVFVVSHFSHNGGLPHHTIAETAAKDGFLTAYDGMAVCVPNT